MRLVKYTFLGALVLCLFSLAAQAQIVQPMRYDNYSFTKQVNVGSGTARITDPSAYFEIGPRSGATKGILPPVCTTAEMNAIISPASWLTIFNSDSAGYCVYNPLLSAWRKISGSGSTPTLQQVLDAGSTLSQNSSILNPSKKSFAIHFDEDKDLQGLIGDTYGSFIGFANGSTLMAGSSGLSSITLGNPIQIVSSGFGHNSMIQVSRDDIRMFPDSDTLHLSGVLKSDGILSTHNDATGSFSIDWQNGWPTLYLQSTDTTAGQEKIFEMNAQANSFGISVYEPTSGNNASIAFSENNHINLTAGGDITIDPGGGGFKFGNPSNFETAILSLNNDDNILSYHRMTHKAKLGNYIETDVNIGGMALSQGNLTLGGGYITMTQDLNLITFDYDGDLFNTISYEKNDLYGYGITNGMLYRSGSEGHNFYEGETGEKYATINNTGIVLPIKSGTYGGYIGSGSMNYGEFGMYAGWNDGTIAAFSDITHRYNYGGEKFWIKESDTAMLQTNLYIKPIDGSNGVANLWDEAGGDFGYVKVSDGQVVFGSYAGETKLEPITGANVSQYRRNIASLNFPSTAAQSSSDLTMTVPGADIDNTVILNITSGTTSYYTAWVSAANTVTVRLNNYGSAAVDPAAQTFLATVFK